VCMYAYVGVLCVHVWLCHITYVYGSVTAHSFVVRWYVHVKQRAVSSMCKLSSMLDTGCWHLGY